MFDKKDKKVTTYDGSEALRSECRNIKGNYYKIGDPEVMNSGQCYLINESYWRCDTGKIIYDYTTSRYQIKSSKYIEGLVGFEKYNESVLGWFEYNSVENVEVYTVDKGYLPCVNEKVIKSNRFYRERLTDGIYYSIRKYEAYKFNRITKTDRGIKHSLPYNCGNMDNNISLYEQYYTPDNSSKNLTNYGSNTKNLSFGLEFETTHGMIPTRICNKLGLIPLRDGSISGLEYVTIPLQGKKGIHTIVDVCKELNLRTKYDDSCSIHIHIGNVPRTKEFMVALYRISCLIQDEMFSMFPIYKKYNFNVKRKNYTKALPTNLSQVMDNTITNKNIDDNFNYLFNWLSGGSNYVGNYKSLGDVYEHPSDPEGRSKWNIESRYYHINFIPLLFGNKQTIEFRIHTPTDDHNKVINFLMVCTSLINYVIKNEKSILNDFSKFMNIDLMSIITDVHGNRTDFSTKMHYYITGRSSTVYSQTSEGSIRGNEKDVNNQGLIWYPYINNFNTVSEKKPVSDEISLETDNVSQMLRDQIRFSRRTRSESFNWGNVGASPSFNISLDETGFNI